LADVEYCGRLKVKSDDDRVFVGQRDDRNERRAVAEEDADEGEDATC
jgi:hypothetical protein